MKRKTQTIKNVLSYLIPYFIIAILGFVKLKYLLSGLGVEIYALNQLFIQIFAYISILEGGIGVLITQAYYKYFTDENIDKNKIVSIFIASKKILNKIATLMIIIGIVVSFFLNILTNNSLSLIYMQFLFILYIVRSAIEYFMFAPRFVLMANQEVYKINITLNIYKIVEAIVEIILLISKQNYALILIFTICIRFFAYFMANRKVYKKFPWLKTINPTETYNFDKKGISAIVSIKVVGAVNDNTDILLISSFLTPMAVTIYSSYNYIVKFLNDIVIQIGNGTVASFGNVIYGKDSKDKEINIFEKINTFFLFAATFFFIALLFSIDKFVILWIGKESLMSKVGLISMLIIMYISIVLKPFTMVRDSIGLFKEFKKVAIFEAVINALLSFVFILKFKKLEVVLYATIIARLLTTMWYYPKYIYKNIFNISILNYLKKNLLNIFSIVIFSFIIAFINKYVLVTNYFNWFLYSLVFCIILLLFLILMYYLFDNSFRELIKDFKEMIFKRKE